MKKQIIFICGLFLLALAACKKDTLTLTENSVKEQHTGNGGFRTFENPLDSAGYWHNYWLDSLYNYSYVGDTGFNADLVETFLENRGVGSIVTYNGFPLGDIAQGNFDIELFLSENSLSEKAVGYILSTLEAVHNPDALGIIEALEEAVEADNEVGDPEKNIIFLGLSVAKYSFAFWTENCEDWTGEIFYADEGPGGNIVENDVTGAIAGGIASGLSGGTDAGSSIVIGAVAASGATAIYEGASWVFGQVGDNTGWW